MDIALRTTLRHIIMHCLFFLPLEQQVRIERRLRGREDHRKLAKADSVIISFGKSGRTWLRVMMSRFYQLRYGISEKSLLAFDNFHNRNRAVPKIFFTHDNYLKDYSENADSKKDYANKPVVLMVRDPADVAVSQYHQWKFRMTERKKRINDYPADRDMDLFTFVMDETSGLPKVIRFMNGWAQSTDQIKTLLIVRYEDMRADPKAALGSILSFIGTPGEDATLQACVEYASIENMRALETKRVFWWSGRRMLAKDKNNPNSFKVRRAKVGGYRDDFTPEQVAEIDRVIAETLSPVFRYGQQADTAEAKAPADMPAAETPGAEKPVGAPTTAAS